MSQFNDAASPLDVSSQELTAAYAFIDEAEEFLLTSHVNSDGDGVGGCLALKQLLERTGKKASIVLNDIPEAYDFLEGVDQIEAAEWSDGTTTGDAVAHAIVLDCPNLERIGGTADYIDAETRILNIDHHKDNQMFGTTNLVAPTVSSTCELVFWLAQSGGIQIDETVAASLYMGILFDTGGFRFSLTTATTFEAAAELVRRGARVDYIADQLFGNKQLESVKLIGVGVDSLELHCDDQVATLHLSHDDMHNGDVEEVVNYGLLVKGVEVALLLKEQEPDYYRISLRSRDRVDVSQIAAEFGGGGHAKASGCRIRGTVEQVRDTLIEQVQKHLS